MPASFNPDQINAFQSIRVSELNQNYCFYKTTNYYIKIFGLPLTTLLLIIMCVFSITTFFAI